LNPGTFLFSFSYSPTLPLSHGNSHQYSDVFNKKLLVVNIQ
jgi:hypothetical protein